MYFIERVPDLLTLTTPSPSEDPKRPPVHNGNVREGMREEIKFYLHRLVSDAEFQISARRNAGHRLFQRLMTSWYKEADQRLRIWYQ